ncbi:BLUF domain-containing protein [Ramlibacter humi]|uniref:BLUF domain-containing protein n=1 Tax=Ramlibacter humi TaxID=2530451 RepID=UPI001431C115|nr:BLUF domain-containing protein [Ramlibacter humi]
MPACPEVPPPVEENVARIVYASQSLIADSVYAQMERIRSSALRHNQPLGVSTALLHQSGWFLQWKEGPGEVLRALMERVARDARHHALRIVHASRGPRLLDGPWSMAIVQCDDAPEAFAQRVALLRRRHEDGCQDEPPAVWRQLSTPLGHPGAERQADPSAFTRVLVCAAQGAGSFELVRWLARRHGQPLVHRRLAGACDLDVATDYVDFPAGERLARVIAMARRGLGVPLARAFLPDYARVLLLLSGEADADLRLVRRVAAACAGRPQAPALLGVGACADIHAPLAQVAHGFGLAYRGVLADSAEPSAAWNAAAPFIH